MAAAGAAAGLVAGAVLSLFLVGAGNGDQVRQGRAEPVESVESAEAVETELETGRAVGTLPVLDPQGPEGMTVYAQQTFWYNDAQWDLQMLVPADQVMDGELLLDDRNHFQIRAVSGDRVYQFLDEGVQLGVPEADVFIDQEDRLHIVIRDVRTACYRITDYQYEKEQDCFVGDQVLDQEGTNDLGGVGGEAPSRSDAPAPAAADGKQSRAWAGEALDRTGQTQVWGYLRELEPDRVLVDLVEYVDGEDRERIRELGLTEQELEGGYAIMDPEPDETVFPLAPGTVYSFIDWGRDLIDSDEPEDLTIVTETQALFARYLDTYEGGQPGMPFLFSLKNGAVVRVEEKPMA